MAKRSQNRGLYYLLSLALLLMILLLVQKAGRSGVREPAQLLKGLKIGDVEQVVVSHKERLVLKREKSAWFLTAPRRYKADLLETIKFLERLTELRFFRSFKAGEKDLPQYELDRPSTTIAVTAAGKTSTMLVGIELETSVGNTSRSLTYVTLKGSGLVFTVETAKISQLQTTVAVLRNKHIFSFERQDLTSVQLNYQGRNLLFRKDAKGDWKTGSGKTVVRNKLMTFLVGFYRFKVDGFESDNANPANYGVRPGRNFIRFTGKSGVHTLAFGREVKNEAMRFCTLSGDRAVYKVSTFRFERMNKQYSDFLPAPPVKNGTEKAGLKSSVSNQ